jgi:hypothetical protein
VGSSRRQGQIGVVAARGTTEAGEIMTAAEVVEEEAEVDMEGAVGGEVADSTDKVDRANFSDKSVVKQTKQIESNQRVTHKI